VADTTAAYAALRPETVGWDASDEWHWAAVTAEPWPDYRAVARFRSKEDAQAYCDLVNGVIATPERDLVHETRYLYDPEYHARVVTAERKAKQRG
jgi:hypothetical protein